MPRSKHKSKVRGDKKHFNKVKDNELKILIYDREKIFPFPPSLLMDLKYTVYVCLSTKSIKAFYILFKLLFKICEIHHHQKKKRSWNKEKGTIFATEVFMKLFEEQQTGITIVV